MAWPEVNDSDLTSRWRVLKRNEAAIAPDRIRDAEAELRRELRLHGVTGTPTFDTAEEREEWEQLYTATVVESVRRYLINTEGWVEETDAIDDYRRTRRRGTDAPTGLVYVDENQVLKLLPNAVRALRRRSSFSIHLGQT